MSPMDLPHFLVTATQGASRGGRYDPSPFIGEGWCGFVFTEKERFAQGRFTRVDPVQHTCEFLPDDPAATGCLRVGQSYPYLDGYWGERAELVLGAARTWCETAFQPADAVRFKTPHGEFWRRASDVEPADGTLISEGWDHEHCSICWEKIGCFGQASGFLSEDDWVCGECFRQFVSPKSIAFVTWQKGYIPPSGS